MLPEARATWSDPDKRMHVDALVALHAVDEMMKKEVMLLG